MTAHRLDVYLIRHAESEACARTDVIAGARMEHDSPLTARGERQAQALAERLQTEGLSFDRVYASPALCAGQTARTVCDAVGFPLDSIRYEPALLERSKGDWEGLRKADIYTPEVLARMNASKGRFRPPNGESLREAERRMRGWLESCLAAEWQPADGSRRIAAFTHCMALKCLLRSTLGFSHDLTYKVVIDSASITQLRHTDALGWHPVRINDAAHLYGLT
jgi:probable phosphoglycerate mutase